MPINIKYVYGATSSRIKALPNATTVIGKPQYSRALTISHGTATTAAASQKMAFMVMYRVKGSDLATNNISNRELLYELCGVECRLLSKTKLIMHLFMIVVGVEHDVVEDLKFV